MVTDPKPWESQGCEVCRTQWESGDRPRFVAESIPDRSELHRCEVCGIWWLLIERYAAAVEPDDIRPTYGEYLDA